MFKITLIGLLCLLSVLYLSAAEGLRFEVASIHPAADDAVFFARPPVNGHFEATAIVARLMIMLAYNVQESQVTGDSPWVATERWTVDAKSEAGKHDSAEETQVMLQNMLEDRFALRVHRETRQHSAYVLTVAKGGSKLKVDDTPAMNVRISGNRIGMEGGDMARLTQLLASAVGQPVIDQTGLTGHYDLSLQWDDAPLPEGGVLGQSAPAVRDTNHGSIFSAVQDQLGLRLVSEHVPVEMLVIDKIERPSAN